MSEKTEYNLLQTYITDPGRFVSTAYRNWGISVAPDLWGYETLVFEWSRDEKETGKLLYSDDSGSRDTAAYERHANIVYRIITGQDLEVR